MTIDHVAAWLMLTFGGLFAGGIFFVAVERTNLWRRMPMEQFVIDFRRSLYRLDPLMPILGTVSALSAVVFGLNNGGPTAGLAWIGVALIVVIMIASIAVAEPMNSKFRRLPEGRVPNGTDDLRKRWRRFHLMRTVPALVSFGCFAAAATM
jgi:dipeptide/tripeptide permease